MNWADVVYVLLLIPLGLVEGLLLALNYFQRELGFRSEAIDRRRRFRREVTADIERITGGQDG